MFNFAGKSATKPAISQVFYLENPAEAKRSATFDRPRFPFERIHRPRVGAGAECESGRVNQIRDLEKEPSCKISHRIDPPVHPKLMDKVNLAEKFSQIPEYWKPHIAGELNGQQVKLTKLKGEFVWHHHDNEDEMFLVVKGHFRIEFRDKAAVHLEPGEFIVVPRGVEHKPVADEECWIVLFEPASTLNTGNVENEFTLRELEKV
jgi:mannose-6-phosphate isomerase-like protein (cupin superfamily)